MQQLIKNMPNLNVDQCVFWNVVEHLWLHDSKVHTYGNTSKVLPQDQHASKTIARYSGKNNRSLLTSWTSPKRSGTNSPRIRRQHDPFSHNLLCCPTESLDNYLIDHLYGELQKCHDGMCIKPTNYVTSSFHGSKHKNASKLQSITDDRKIDGIYTCNVVYKVPNFSMPLWTCILSTFPTTGTIETLWYLSYVAATSTHRRTNRDGRVPT